MATGERAVNSSTLSLTINEMAQARSKRASVERLCATIAHRIAVINRTLTSRK
ncbi:MAG: hypothetical protein ACREJO_16170 [Phycisphaerales bacterium]